MKLRVALFWATLSVACAHASLDRSSVNGPHRDGVTVSEVPVRGAAVEVSWLPKGCAPKQNPSPDPRVRPQRVYVCPTVTSGELIAVDAQYIYLSGSGDDWRVGLRSVARRRIEKVSITVGPSVSKGLEVWTALGCASTISHGGYLIFTGPMWLGAGISAAVNDSSAAHAVAESTRELDQVFQFARFPQGLPPPPAAPRATVPAGVAPSAAVAAAPAIVSTDAGVSVSTDAGASVADDAGTQASHDGGA